MGRNLSPVVRRELANLDKDPESRKSAMKALKSYVRDLDSKAIPFFLAQVSETKGSGSSSGECTISLYEVLARVHGRNIVPQIGNIMSTIVKTLMTSAGSFPLHQACSKVVPAIARYGIDPLTPDGEKAKIIYSLCEPLSDILMGSPESVTSGAALCLKALVESDNWRFVSEDLVNDVCLRVAGALEEKLTQTNSHMGLVMALAKHNSLTVEAYARSLIRSGLHILAADVAEGNSHKRFTAIQMINFLMKFVDSRSIFSELTKIIDMMEKCYSDDQMPFVRAVAFETLQTAKMIAGEKCSKSERNSSSVTVSNFSRKGRSKRNSEGVGDNLSVRGFRSPRFGSPESQTIHSFNADDSFPESPLSTGQVSCNFRRRRLVNRKLLSKENGGVDVSLKDGLYSEVGSVDDCSEPYFEHFADSELSSSERDGMEGFSGFVHASPTDTVSRSATPSPQKTQSQYNMDDIMIFTTPRELIHSLQVLDEADTDLPKKEAMKFRSQTSHEVGWRSESQLDGNGLCQHERGSEVQCENNVADGEVEPSGHDSVSYMGEGPVIAHCKASDEANHGVENEISSVSLKRRSFKKAAIHLVFGVSLILTAVIFSGIWVDDQEKYFNLVPT